MRAFVSVPVPPLLADPDLPSFSAAAPAHLTLRFFAELPEALIVPVAAAVRAVGSATPPFPLGLSGLGAFPDARRPRVVWVGLAAGAAELQAVASRLDDALGAIGLPSAERRPFVPHLTLFRVHGRADVVRFQRLAERLGSRRLADGMATELQLNRSELGRGGAVHTVLVSQRLGAPA